MAVEQRREHMGLNIWLAIKDSSCVPVSINLPGDKKKLFHQPNTGSGWTEVVKYEYVGYRSSEKCYDLSWP